MANTILYEQPVNELIRTLLRLEHLFQQTELLLDTSNPDNTGMTMRSLIEILSILERPDLKSKLAKELNSQLNNLTKLSKSPLIDNHKLKSVLGNLQAATSRIESTPGRLGNLIRENEFLSYIRQHISNPGGTCSFDTPCYYYWLQQPLEQQLSQLKEWYGALEHIQETIALLLKLTRENSVPQQEIAKEGFFQQALDLQSPQQLIQIFVPKKEQAFPEISVGRHRVSIRFLIPDYQGRPAQTKDDIKFKLNCCRA